MRKVIAVIIVSLLLSQSAFAMENNKKSPEAMEQTILRLLFTPAHNAISEYYGEPRQYWHDELLSIRQVSDTPYYEAVMRVETFYGPHNPPYGIETMTFYVSYGKAMQIKYDHQDD